MVLILLIWDFSLILYLGSLMLNRHDLLKVYEKIYPHETYQAQFAVTSNAVLKNIMTLLESAIFTDTTDNIPVTDLYKLAAPILVPYRQATVETSQLLFKIFKTLNTKVIVRGMDKIPKNVPLVVIANHVGINDVITGSYLDQIRGPGNSIFLGVQYSPYLKTNENTFASVKWNGSLVPGTEAKLIERIKNGQALLIFPEGSFMGNKFFDGYLRMSIQANAWIQPVRIKLRYPEWINFVSGISPLVGSTLVRALMWRIYRNNQLEIIFGDPISPDQISQDVLNQTYLDKWGRVRYMDSILEKHHQIIKTLS